MNERDVLEVGPRGPADEGVLWGPGEEEVKNGSQCRTRAPERMERVRKGVQGRCSGGS